MIGLMIDATEASLRHAHAEGLEHGQNRGFMLEVLFAPRTEHYVLQTVRRKLGCQNKTFGHSDWQMASLCFTRL